MSNEKSKDEKEQNSKTSSSFNKQIKSVDKVPYVRKYDNNRKFENSQKFANNQKFQNVGKFTNTSSTLKNSTQDKKKFSPKQPNFPNPSISKPNKVSYTKGKSDVSTINRWFEGK